MPTFGALPVSQSSVAKDRLAARVRSHRWRERTRASGNGRIRFRRVGGRGGNSFSPAFRSGVGPVGSRRSRSSFLAGYGLPPGANRRRLSILGNIAQLLPNVKNKIRTSVAPERGDEKDRAGEARSRPPRPFRSISSRSLDSRFRGNDGGGGRGTGTVASLGHHRSPLRHSRERACEEIPTCPRGRRFSRPSARNPRARGACPRESGGMTREARDDGPREAVAAPPPLVIPAKAGIQGGKGRVFGRIRLDRRLPSGRRHRPLVSTEAGNGIRIWIPAFAGMTRGDPGTLAPGRPSARGGYAKGFFTRSKAGIQGGEGRILGVRLAPTSQALRPHGGRRRDTKQPLRHSRESGNPGRGRTGPLRPPRADVTGPSSPRKRDAGCGYGFPLSSV